MDPVLAVGLLLSFSYLAGRAISRLKLPMVTGYLLLGLAFGVSALGIIPLKLNLRLGWLIELALIFIAFHIGSQLRTETFRRMGGALVLIIVLETLGAFAFLFLAVLLTYGGFVPSFLIAAIGCATAPAVTVLVLNEYRASGPLSQVLLACVGMDDALGLTAYSVAASVAHASFGGSHISPCILAAKIALGVVCSLSVGLGAGLILDSLVRRARHPEDILIISIGVLALASGLMENPVKGVRFSELLTAMAVGFYMGNFSPRRDAVGRALDGFSMPFYVLYFSLAGARLNFKFLISLGKVAGAYLVARFVGKSLGAWMGAAISKAPDVIKKYTGFGLFSQAGIAIGLALHAADEFPQLSDLIISIALGTTIVTEILGPLMTKFAITRAGEVGRG